MGFIEGYFFLVQKSSSEVECEALNGQESALLCYDKLVAVPLEYNQAGLHSHKRQEMDPPKYN